MSLILRQRTHWAVQGGGQGLTNMYFEGAEGTEPSRTAVAAAVRAFYDTLKGQFAKGVTWTFEGELAGVNTIGGQVYDFFPCTAPGQVSSTSVTAYAAPAGAVVEWRASGVLNGRRVKGRTYLVPLNSGTFQDDGTLAPATMTAILGAANALLAAADAATHPLVVYSPTHEAHDTVTSVRVNDKAAILRSRRD